MDYIWHYASPLGGMTMVSDGESLVGLAFDKEHEGCERKLPVFDETCRWLDVYFSGQVPDFTPPLAPHGTAFRRAVWDILMGIPYGKTMTYGEIAVRMAGQQGRPRMSPQAVGGAVGHNPIALIIPCHRVIGADGNLTGYAAGLHRKQSLLQLERIIP